MRSIASISLTIIRLYLREPLTVFLSIGLLALMMVLFGVMSGGDILNLRLPVGLVTPPGLHSARIDALEQDEVLSVRHAPNRAALAEMIRTAQVIGGVVVTSASQGTLNATAVVSDSPQNHWTKMGIEHLRSVLSGVTADTRGISVESQHIEVVNNRFIDFIFPGVLALSILQACLGSAVVLLDAQKSGVLRRLQLTPLTPLQLFLGFLVGRCAIVLLHLLVLGLVAKLFFGAQILASPVALVVTVLLGILCFMSMAGAVAFVAPSFESGAIMTQMLNFPMAFLCGVFFRNENMPHAVQWFVQAMPLTYLVEMMRGTIQAALPLSAFVPQMSVLLGWTIVSVVLLLLAARFKPVVQS